jgi:hypothetical protein
MIPEAPMTHRARNRVAVSVGVATVIALGVPACEKKGPAEKAGAAVDKAGRDAGKAVDRAADKVKDAVK